MSNKFLEITFDTLKYLIKNKKNKPTALITCNDDGLFSVTVSVEMDQNYKIVKKMGSQHYKQIASLLVMLRDAGIDDVEISGVTQIKDNSITKRRKIKAS